jgi:hypothetical protein
MVPSSGLAVSSAFIRPASVSPGDGGLQFGFLTYRKRIVILKAGPMLKRAPKRLWGTVSTTG